MKLRRPTIKPLTTFLLLAVVGILGSTWLLRRAQAEAMRQSAAEGPRPTEINLTQQEFITSRSAGSELLFQLAFASLGALLGLRFSDKARVHIGSHAHFAAAGMLLSSIYNAFLYQESLARILEGPLDVLYGAELRYPVVCQFWFLFAAVALLSVSLFRPVRKMAAASLLAFVGGALPATAQVAPATLASCGAQWGQSRGLDSSTLATSELGELATRVARRSEVDIQGLSSADRCAFVSALGDGLRYAAIAAGAAADGGKQTRAINALVRRSLSTMSDPTFSPGELLQHLLAAAQIWREPAAVLDIDGGSKTLFVAVYDPRNPQLQWRGYTRLLLRIPPGTYELSVSENGVIVNRRSLSVGDGDRLPISLAAQP